MLPVKPQHNSRSEATPVVLDNYRSGIEALFEARSKHVVSNGSSEHAAMLFELFFRKAQDRVVIFCHNLSRSVFSKPFVVQAASEALARGIRISALIQEPAESEEFRKLADQHSNLDIRQARSPVVKQMTPNFAVMDTTALRFEPDRQQCIASACMYDPSEAIKLIGIFNRLSALDSAAVAA